LYGAVGLPPLACKPLAKSIFRVPKLNNLELNNLVHPARERGDHEGSIAMGRIVDLPSIKPRSTSRCQGLRKLSPDLISKARDETATQVTRVGLTFLGTAAFCLLSLLSPDSALLGGSEKIIVPFAGPVSFFGFMLLGPAVLIALRVCLQIYVEHSDRLDRLARSVSVVRAPTLLPLQNSLIRLVSGLVFYIASGNDALCMEGRRVPRLGIRSVRPCGSGHRQPCHATVH
jgi:hypothetical protein